MTTIITLSLILKVTNFFNYPGDEHAFLSFSFLIEKLGKLFLDI